MHSGVCFSAQNRLVFLIHNFKNSISICLISPWVIRNIEPITWPGLTFHKSRVVSHPHGTDQAIHIHPSHSNNSFIKSTMDRKTDGGWLHIMNTTQPERHLNIIKSCNENLPHNASTRKYISKIIQTSLVQRLRRSLAYFRLFCSITIDSCV